MNILKGIKMKNSFFILVFILLSKITVSSALAEEEINIQTNVPYNLEGIVDIGDISTDISLPLSGIQSLSLEIIAPVPGVKFSLIDPSGNIFVTEGDSRLSFIDGASLSQALPGGIFYLDSVDINYNGNWTIRLTYPTAQEKTVILSTVMTVTEYHVGLVLGGDNFFVGKDTTMGVLVLHNGLPITNLKPQITITDIDIPTSAETYIAKDDGGEYDGMINDGIYSLGYSFNSAGTYLIKAYVEIPTTSGNIIRETESKVNVKSSPAYITGFNYDILYKSNSTGQCAYQVNQTVDVVVIEEDEYTIRSSLYDSNNNKMLKKEGLILTPGNHTVVLSFSSDEINEYLSNGAPFSFGNIDLISVGGTNIEVVSSFNDTEKSGINLNEVCQPLIVIGKKLNVIENLKDGYLESLSIKIPVTVSTSSYYQLSFKVVGSGNENISLVSNSQYLTSGLNEVSILLLADQLQNIDGPYEIISGLVLGGGSSVTKTFVGETPLYEKWQFYPTKQGDLDNDGDVDVYDRNILILHRNKPALTPGDRRDINRDGRIDIRDIGLISRLR